MRVTAVPCRTTGGRSTDLEKDLIFPAAHGGHVYLQYASHRRPLWYDWGATDLGKALIFPAAHEGHV